ncbi:MAG TPA: MFS transporter, partial [Candidatus Limnocylindrales bacterium]
PIAIVGYVVQMAAVPALALAGSWPAAAMLILLERIGKATRNPPKDVMLSHAGREIGVGWAFGLHEALDQLGALAGPLVIALVLLLQNDYRLAFASLAVPAAITLVVLALARLQYPHPEELEGRPVDVRTEGLPRTFWLYLAAASLVAAGFADFPLIAFHLQQAAVVAAPVVPVLYAVAMGVGGLGALVLGRMFDRTGIRILVPLTVVSAAYAPLAFLGGPAAAALGIVLWGVGLGVHESIVPAAVALMAPVHRRASAYGLFTAAFGISWFVGSALMGLLYDVAFPVLIAFAVVAELAAVPLLLRVRSLMAAPA